MALHSSTCFSVIVRPSLATLLHLTSRWASPVSWPAKDEMQHVRSNSQRAWKDGWRSKILWWRGLARIESRLDKYRWGLNALFWREMSCLRNVSFLLVVWIWNFCRQAPLASLLTKKWNKFFYCWNANMVVIQPATVNTSINWHTSTVGNLSGFNEQSELQISKISKIVVYHGVGG